jgi:hypothetical protein
VGRFRAIIQPGREIARAATTDREIAKTAAGQEALITCVLREGLTRADRGA